MNSWTQPSLLDFLQPEPPHNQPAGLYCTQCDEPSPTRYEFVTTHARDQYGVCAHPKGKQQAATHKALLTQHKEPPEPDISAHFLLYAAGGWSNTVPQKPEHIIHCKCGYKNTNLTTFQDHLRTIQ